MSKTIALDLDYRMYDCLQLAVVGLRDEIDRGDLGIDEEDTDFFPTLERLEQSLVRIEKEFFQNA